MVGSAASGDPAWRNCGRHEAAGRVQKPDSQPAEAGKLPVLGAGPDAGQH